MAPRFRDNPDADLSRRQFTIATLQMNIYIRERAYVNEKYKFRIPQEYAAVQHG
jgi:hypothetical protein